ncbi:ATP phosphoribosyltransferase regulatory subunit [Gorillibacterium timonense]|uniref:ATP phosphoribosyltransferase regulatory subunit n=1 Tax=Gorillibacterium timonense TaxID=1689269 RepID=UPI00071E24ED|nr:ATP phosphoribosyltransferase regulatory subunit [Gorillibacterium timonense]
MSKPRGFEKPTGVKDYVPEAVERLRRIEFRVLECMKRWGYRQIITPTLEFYDTVGMASATTDKKLFKLLDQNGRTLVLRSDMTAPIARVVSSLLKEEPLPLRLCYHSNVFRAFAEEAGKESEFFQTGVELVGDASAEADAEVIALAVASLQAAGIGEFKIALGHIGFLNGLFEELLPWQPEKQEILKESLMNRDYVGYRRILSEIGLSERTEEKLESILRIHGGAEVLDEAHGLTRNAEAQEAIEHLRSMLEVLNAYGMAGHVLVDLTMVGDFGYYTGMTFEGYASGLGFPVVSGGRYDNLLGQFGRPAPATGFALKTNRILEWGSEPTEEPMKTTILYRAEKRTVALGKAMELRASGHRIVETRLVLEGEELPHIAGELLVFE